MEKIEKSSEHIWKMAVNAFNHEFPMANTWYHYFFGEARHSSNAKTIRTLVVIELAFHTVITLMNLAHDFRFAVLEQTAGTTVTLAIVHCCLSTGSLTWHESSRILDGVEALLSLILFAFAPAAMVELIDQKKECDSHPHKDFTCSTRDVSSVNDVCVLSQNTRCPTSGNSGYYDVLHGIMITYLVYIWVSTLLKFGFHARFRTEHTSFHDMKQSVSGHHHGHHHSHHSHHAQPGAHHEFQMSHPSHDAPTVPPYAHGAPAKSVIPHDHPTSVISHDHHASHHHPAPGMRAGMNEVMGGGRHGDTRRSRTPRSRSVSPMGSRGSPPRRSRSASPRHGHAR